MILTGSYREARTAVSERSGPAQTLPLAALPDVRLDVGAALPEAAQLPAFHVPNVLQWCWRYLAALQSHRSFANTRTCPAKDPDLPGEVTRDRGPDLLPLHAIPGSDLLQPPGGARSSTRVNNKKFLTRSRFPACSSPQ